ncbi:dnaJ homolog subfamily C member 24 isoform X1 [Colius striatus]|uniref:dnaJ homolog subfamily C member 24 isoform X1 n=1 Tax=Colius striatus TaxID=57412 RepID=UPI0005297758|nr:dnaJ homolog subfamily C member 24 isoform X1 [Colius striatus]XP_061855747.1 dnaJ homolog subfamily C member 24 isoform X1 [Colius striatus]
MAFERITQKDWYKILGAKPSDSPAELKRKYQKLVLLYHPDKQKADVPAGEVEERVQRFIEIDQAWKILGNEETKKEYDLQQREDNLTKEWPLHAQICLEDMSWNEDEQCYTLSCRCGGNYTIFKSETKDASLVCCDTCSLVIEILQ